MSGAPDLFAQAGDLVTVLVPARNEEATLPAALQSILAQDYDRLEVIVVEGGSTDATADIVRDHAARDPRVRLVEQPVPSIPRSLNTGLAAAHGTWLVRVDAHSLIPVDYVSRLLAHLTQGDWGGVGGRKDAVAKTPMGKVIGQALGSPIAVGGSVYHHGTTVQTVDHIPFGAYSVSMLRSLGGWDEALLVNEDFELDQRILQSGRRLLFDPAIAIKWSCRENLRDLARQYSRYGRGKPAVARKHPHSLRLRHLAPPILVVSWALAGLAALTGHRRAAAGIVLPYAGILTLGAAVASHTDKSEPAPSKLQFAAVVATMHGAWGVGFLRGCLQAAKNGR